MKIPSLALAVSLGLLSPVLVSSASAQVLFTQDFSSSSTVANYVNAATPTQNQFTLISTPTGSAWSISSGELLLTQTTNANAAIRRGIDMVGTPVGALSFSMDINFTFTSADNTRLLTGLIGSQSTTDAWLSFGIDSTGTANTWNITSDATNTFTGPQTLTLVMNDSGAPITYTAPDSSVQSLAFGAYDLWVGTTSVFLDRTAGVNTSFALNQFGMTVQNTAGGAGTFAFDNFNVVAVPEPATWGLLTATLTATMLLRRRKSRRDLGVMAK
jgi:hypothetical protein